MSDKPISPLRQRMIDDMTARRFSEKVQKAYVRHVRTFAAFADRRVLIALVLQVGGSSDPKVSAAITAANIAVDMLNALVAAKAGGTPNGAGLENRPAAFSPDFDARDYSFDDSRATLSLKDQRSRTGTELPADAPTERRRKFTSKSKAHHHGSLCLRR